MIYLRFYFIEISPRDFSSVTIPEPPKPTSLEIRSSSLPFVQNQGIKPLAYIVSGKNINGIAMPSFSELNSMLSANKPVPSASASSILGNPMLFALR
jgi:hypothetical protein